MTISRITLVLLALALLLAPSALAGEPPAPNAVALRVAEDLEATHLGTDRFGNLWWWNRNSRSIRVLSPKGDRLLTTEIDGKRPTAVTFDAEWGAAALDLERDLLLFPSLTEPTVHVQRDGKATHLSWIEGGRLAVASSRADHLIEIWDVEKRQIVERWGTEEPIPDGPGFHRLRATLLAWDWTREVLWTLETFTGELVAFSLKGEELVRRTLTHPRFEKTQAWVEEMEEKATGPNDREDSYLNLWSSLSLDPDGAAWVLEGCDRDRGALQLIRVAPDGRVEKRAQKPSGCCASGVHFWGKEMVPFRDPRFPGLCN